jgi:Asp-tRNA(Asn)/Glu-tRNA(Gln) amidotransferase A subunit family amidase
MSEPREDEVLTRRGLLKRAGSVVAAGLLCSAAAPPGAALEKPDPPKGQLPGEDLCYPPATEIAERVRAGKLSAEELTTTILKRIDALNPKLDAFCKGAIDHKGALEAAREADKLIKEGDRNKLANLPLLGVPVAVKDDLEVNDLPYTSGSKLNEKKTPPDYDDLAVSRLRKAGAVILGKTNLPEFGHKGTTDNLLFGTTANPWDLGKTPGGSSGGNGSALAAGLAYLALGTDVGGSVRIPASFCGIVGLKPTFGRVPRVPAGNVFTIWVTGPMARTVADVALLMRVISGPDERDPYALPELPARDWDVKQPLPGKLRIAWVPHLLGAPVDPAVAAAAEAAAKLLHNPRAGVDVITHKEPLWADTPHEAFATLTGVGAMTEAEIYTEADYREKRELLSPTFRKMVEKALRVKRQDYLNARVAVTTFIEKAAAVFDQYDLLTTPTVTVPAFSKALAEGPELANDIRIDPHLGWALTKPFNVTGQPAITVPCGWTEGKKPLPIGLQIAGRRRADGLVLRVAETVEGLLQKKLPRRKPSYS